MEISTNPQVDFDPSLPIGYSCGNLRYSARVYERDGIAQSIVLDNSSSPITFNPANISFYSLEMNKFKAGTYLIELKA